MVNLIGDIMSEFNHRVGQNIAIDTTTAWVAAEAAHSSAISQLKRTGESVVAQRQEFLTVMHDHYTDGDSGQHLRFTGSTISHFLQRYMRPEVAEGVYGKAVTDTIDILDDREVSEFVIFHGGSGQALPLVSLGYVGNGNDGMLPKLLIDTSEFVDSGNAAIRYISAQSDGMKQKVPTLFEIGRGPFRSYENRWRQSGSDNRGFLGNLDGRFNVIETNHREVERRIDRADRDHTLLVLGKGAVRLSLPILLDEYPDANGLVYVRQELELKGIETGLTEIKKAEQGDVMSDKFTELVRTTILGGVSYLSDSDHRMINLGLGEDSPRTKAAITRETLLDVFGEGGKESEQFCDRLVKMLDLSKVEAVTSRKEASELATQYMEEIKHRLFEILEINRNGETITTEEQSGVSEVLSHRHVYQQVFSAMKRKALMDMYKSRFSRRTLEGLDTPAKVYALVNYVQYPQEQY